MSIHAFWDKTWVLTHIIHTDTNRNVDIISKQEQKQMSNFSNIMVFARVRALMHKTKETNSLLLEMFIM